ncbi:MAG: hypothetical protein PHF84_04050 [bacterium]|nr:hypothetical protein [bacterium]
MKTIRLMILLLLLRPFLSTNLHAGNTAASLDLAGNAYEKNLGYGAVAEYDNINSAAYNPAVIGNIRSLNGAITYMDYFSDFSLFYGHIVYPIPKIINVSCRVCYLSTPSVKDIETGEDLDYNEFFISLGTGYTFWKKLTLGGQASFYRAGIADRSGNTFFGDIGANYRIDLPTIEPNQFVLGFSILNLGPGIKFIQSASSLPLNFNCGAEYIYKYNYKLLLGIRKYYDHSGILPSLGAEFTLFHTVSARAAVINDINDTVKYALGLGFHLDYSGYDLLLDYAFMPAINIDNASIITLTFKFPVPEEENGKEKENNWKNMWKPK